jgi:hypothetical protein
MADRYWVGGTGGWDNTTTTNWATSSGGSGGASPPTTSDNVFFDANSNSGTSAFTVTLSSSGSPSCLNFDATAIDGTMTLSAGLSGSLIVAGSWVNPATLFAVTSIGGSITFSSNNANTVDTKGISFPLDVRFGVSPGTGSWTLNSAFTITGNFIPGAGTFNTNNFALSALGITKSVAGNFTLNLGSSAVTLTGTTVFSQSATTGVYTINAGTSTITCNNTGATVFSMLNATTFYNVSFTGANQAVTFNNSSTLVNTLVFNDLSFSTGPTTLGRKSLSFYGGCSCTINGTLTIAGSADTRYRNSFGVVSITQPQMSLTCNTYNIRNTDFINCAVSGTTATGTSIGDAGGNSNITFTTPKTVYWNLAAGGTVISTAYATSSGGTPALANFPLPQDTLIFENTGLNTSATVTWSTSYYLPAIDASTRTNAMTIAFGTTTSYICGNVSLPSNVTITASTGSLALQTIGSNRTNTISMFSFPGLQLVINGFNNGTIKLLRNLIHSTPGNAPTSQYRGTFDLNGFTFICPYFQVVSGVGFTMTCVMAFGSGGSIAVKATQSSAFIINNANTSWSYTGTGTIRGNSSTTSAFTISNPAGQSLPTIGLNGTATVTILNSCTIADVAVVTAGVACALKLTSGITVTASDFTLTGSAGFLASISAVTAGSRATLTKASGTVSSDYLSIQDSVVTGGAAWYAGANSTNVSNNSGWIFTAPPVVPSATNSNFLQFF